MTLKEAKEILKAKFEKDFKDDPWDTLFGAIVVAALFSLAFALIALVLIAAANVALSAGGC